MEINVLENLKGERDICYIPKFGSTKWSGFKGIGL